MYLDTQHPQSQLSVLLLHPSPFNSTVISILHALKMTTVAFIDNDAIKQLSKAVFTFKNYYLADDAHRNDVKAYKAEKYRGLTPFNKGYYRIIAKHMQDMLDWTRQIDSDSDTEDIGGQTLPDLSRWVSESAHGNHQ
jgi:hypothetical protein